GVVDGLRLLVLGLRKDLRLPVATSTLVVESGLLRVRPGRLEVRAHRRDRGLPSRVLSRELGAVDLKEELSAVHLVPLLDREVDDLAHDERRQVDLAARLDLAVGGDLR